MNYAQLDQNNTVVAVTQVAAPMVEIPSLDAALLGCVYAGGVFTPPAPVAETRYISVGAFFDRFGANKWPILADTNAMVQALVKDCSVRKYINLDDPQLPSGLAMLVAAGHAIDPNAIINDPVQPGERP